MRIVLWGYDDGNAPEGVDCRRAAVPRGAMADARVGWRLASSSTTTTSTSSSSSSLCWCLLVSSSASASSSSSLWCRREDSVEEGREAVVCGEEYVEEGK